MEYPTHVNGEVQPYSTPMPNLVNAAQPLLTRVGDVTIAPFQTVANGGKDIVPISGNVPFATIGLAEGDPKGLNPWR